VIATAAQLTFKNAQEPVAFECMNKGKAAGKVYLKFSRKAVCDQHSE
jgi:hypothetical protein